MPDHATLITLLGLLALATPVLLLGVLGVSSLLDRRLGEEAIGKACQAAIVTGLLAAVTVLGLMLRHGTRHESIEVGDWVAIPHYHFSVKLIFDRLSVPFAILSFALCGTIAAEKVELLLEHPVGPQTAVLLRKSRVQVVHPEHLQEPEEADGFTVRL